MIDNSHDRGAQVDACQAIICQPAGSHEQVRAQRRDGWTKAVRAKFLDTVAATANIAGSARAAGMLPCSAYALRRRDETFAGLWDAALAEGYARIETALLARTLVVETNPAGIGESGGTGAADGGDGGSPPADILDPELALRVLALRNAALAGRTARRQGGPPIRRATREELVEALLKRLAALADRAAKEAR